MIFTLYDVPSSVPTSHGYKFRVRDGNHLQLGVHNSISATPTIQSGDGVILETTEIK